MLKSYKFKLKIFNDTVCEILIILNPKTHNINKKNRVYSNCKVPALIFIFAGFN